MIENARRAFDRVARHCCTGRAPYSSLERLVALIVAMHVEGGVAVLSVREIAQAADLSPRATRAALRTLSAGPLSIFVRGCALKSTFSIRDHVGRANQQGDQKGTAA